MNKKHMNVFKKFTALFTCFLLLLITSDFNRFVAYSLESDLIEFGEETTEEMIMAEETDDNPGIIDSEGFVTKNDDGMYTARSESDSIKINVSFTEEANIPEGSQISVREIVTDTQQYANYFEESGAVLNRSIPENSETEIELQYARFFDISFLYDGETIEPNSAVLVEITYDRPVLNTASGMIMADVIHFAEDGSILMEAVVEQTDAWSVTEEADTAVTDIVSFETESFSAYGVLYYTNTDGIGNALDGKKYAIVRYTGTSTSNGNGVAIGTQTVNSNHLSGTTVTISAKASVADRYSEYPDGYAQFIFNAEITEWSFRYIIGNKYYIIANVDGEEKYLTINSGGIGLEKEPTDNSVITVQTDGTGSYANKLRFYCENSQKAINLSGGSQTNGFGSFSDRKENEWFVLAEKVSDDEFVKLIIHSADKVSVSDTVNLTNDAEVVVYSKFWNAGSNAYENYAIDGYGNLVNIWESGSVMQWNDVENTSLYWQFIQYSDTGYYEFYNPVTGMYLAPQSGQILSNSTIGVTLSGRENGDYSSTIEAWDNNVWGWYGYHYTDSLKLIPVPDTQAAKMCFAVKKESRAFQPVDTVDSKAAGITIKMYDYPHTRESNGSLNGGSSGFQTTIIGENSFTGDGNGARTGLVEKRLNEAGFPVAVRTGKSLETLFAGNDTYPEREANHLFIKSIYDETGYFEYSCFDNSAFLMNENGQNATPSAEGYYDVNDFTVYQELVTPSNATKNSHRRGNFLPFNRADSGNSKNKNLYGSDGNSLPNDNPRYNEDIYIPSSPDYFFGMSIEATFMIPENGCDENGNPLIFEFVGDDDFWLFIDDVLVLDLGGIHNALTGTVNFSTGEVSTYNGYNSNTYTVTTLIDCFKAAGVFPDGTAWDDSKVSSYFKNDVSFASNEGVFKDYSSHTMKIFYMERGAGASNLKLRFNLATVPENSVFLEKKLTGTQTTDYSNTKYAYQLWYKPTYSEKFVLYENPTGDERAHYENRSEPVEYAESAEINGETYDNVFYLRAEEKAEFTMLNKETEYYFVELGVLNQEYDYVNINGQRVYDSNFSEINEKEYADIKCSPETVNNRKRVVYENHVDPDYLKKLIITKRVVDKDGNPVENDKTGFEFQVYFKDKNGQLAPYRKGEYYVMDSDDNYYVYVNGKLSNHGKDKVVCSVSGNNGSVAGIPDGFSVVIDELMPCAVFKIDELESKIPLGYKWQSYARVENNDGATYNLLEDGVYNIGMIRENTNAHMVVINEKGFGITVNKDWGDSKYTLSHATIYIALFHKDANETLKFVEGTFRELVSPNTSVYYFNDEQEASEYVAMEVNPNTVRWNEDNSAVIDCRPYAPDAVTRLNATTLSGAEYQFDYAVSYNQGEIGGTGNNVRTDTISNSRDFLKIIKKSTSGLYLSGAVFTLTDTTENTVLGTFTSDSDGLITNAYFTAGHSYNLKEVSAPRGYQILSEAVTINVDGDNKISIQWSSADNSLVDVQYSADDKSGVLTIKDKPKELNLRKTDTDGNPLKGAEFTIYQFDKAQNKKYTSSGFRKLVSDENGIFYGETLTNGYYLIEEVTPPNGYAKPDYDVVMYIGLENNSVDELYSVKYDSSKGTYERVSDLLDKWVVKKEGSTTINFPNEKLSGNLVIRKTIDGIDASKGYPTFMFKVTQTKDENGNAIISGTEYIRCISFTSSDTETSKEITLNALPIGTYKVEELSSLHYTASGLTVYGDDRAIISSKTTASITLSSDDAVTVAYKNELKDDDIPSYTAFADNNISYSSPAASQSRK